MNIEANHLLLLLLIVFLAYFFYNKSLSKPQNIVYNVHRSLPWKRNLYSRANSRKNKKIPLPYPSLTGNAQAGIWA